MTRRLAYAPQAITPRHFDKHYVHRADAAAQLPRKALGVVLVTLLQSILSIVQMSEAGRQVIYGAVIILMLLVYGRGPKVVS
jgi:hypothetical protein